MNETRVVAKSIKDRLYEVQSRDGDRFVFRFATSNGREGTLEGPAVWAPGHIPYDGMATILIDMALRVAADDAARDGVVTS